MSLLGIIYGGVLNFAYLIRSNHSFKNKVRILFTWVRIHLKFLFFSKVFKLKSEKIFGYTIQAFEYETIRFLFDEIFFRNEYLFYSENKKPVIFDCGANIGFAALFFKWLYPESVIYAFEPDGKTFEILKENIVQNRLENVYLFNSAISDRSGTIDFFVDLKNPSSMLMSTKQERMPKDRIRVNCISLSAFMKDKKIQHVDFVKMDIEGSEQEAIRDLDKHNQLKKIIKLVVEYHHKINTYKSNLGEFLQIFERNGFEYQIDTKCIPTNSENKFQDVLLYVYKSKRNVWMGSET